MKQRFISILTDSISRCCADIIVNYFSTNNRVIKTKQELDTLLAELNNMCDSTIVVDLYGIFSGINYKDKDNIMEKLRYHSIYNNITIIVFVFKYDNLLRYLNNYQIMLSDLVLTISEYEINIYKSRYAQQQNTELLKELQKYLIIGMRRQKLLNIYN